MEKHSSTVHSHAVTHAKGSSRGGVNGSRHHSRVLALRMSDTRPPGEQRSHFINNLWLTVRTLTRFTAPASSKFSQRFSDLQREFNPGATLSCHGGLLF